MNVLGRPEGVLYCNTIIVGFLCKPLYTHSIFWDGTSCIQRYLHVVLAIHRSHAQMISIAVTDVDDPILAATDITRTIASF